MYLLFTTFTHPSIYDKIRIGDVLDKAMKPITESELLKLISTATTACTKASEGDAAEEIRAVDTLKVLASHAVSSELLSKTEAGKKVKKLTKLTSEAIKVAANSTIDAWKECVRQEQALKASVSNQKKEEIQAAAKVSSALPDMERHSSLASSPSGADLGNIPTPKGGGISKLIGQPARCGDPTRNKIRDLLAETLALACSDEIPAECDPCKVAVEVEVAMFRQAGDVVDAKYKAKFRSLSFNLKDPNNPDLKTKVTHNNAPDNA